jgi:DNA-binding beta-propeller fold protein YncE
MTHQRLVAFLALNLLAWLTFAFVSHVSAVPVNGVGGNAQNHATGNSALKSIDVATTGGDFQAPYDSAIDAYAQNIYFTATGPNGPGVFHVPAAGGTATEISTGHPFVAPTGIAIGSGNQHAYVADPEAWKGGRIFVLAVGGGMPEPLHGTEGTAPRGLDVVQENGHDIVYFTGKDPDDNQVAVFKIPASGASRPTIVAKGEPLIAPDGVTVAESGAVYVTDRAASGACSGSVFKITRNKIRKLVDDVILGNPAGLALTLDESELLVSAFQSDGDHDQLLVVDLRYAITG